MRQSITPVVERMREQTQLIRDLEEPGEEEEEAYPEYPKEFWKKKNKEVITVTVDYSLSHLTNLIKKGLIDLAPKHQRRHRWTDKRKSKLIESFIMSIPIPPVFLNEESGGSYSVIDGRQRLIAISEFMKGELTLSGLEVFENFNGKTIRHLPQDYVDKLENLYTLRALIVIRETTKHVMLEVFTRVNTGGVQLNPQEIRNATFQGPLNDMVMELSQSERFHSLLRIREKTRSSIWNKMKDAELVLRYITFKDKWSEFPGPLKTNMDNYMKKNQYIRKQEIEKIEHDFNRTIGVVGAFFGKYAFRRWNPERGRRGTWFKAVNSAIYDAQMFSCQDFDSEQATGKETAILEGMKSLFEDDKFNEYVSRGTNTPEFFRNRIQMVKGMVLAAIERT